MKNQILKTALDCNYWRFIMSLDNKLIVPSVERAVNDLEFSFECYGTQKLKIKPSDYRGLERVFWNYYSHDAKAITIDTEAGTLDLVNDRVDNLDIVPSHKYLLWGILDKNLQFSRYALTRWPISAYTGISAGGNKGEITTFTGVDDAFQFTKGARVRVINDNEWNYGYIIGVGSNLLQVELDNRPYGTDISSLSGAEIMQFSRYRPFVVSISGQTLYSNHYRLLGWCELGIDDSGTGGVDHREDVMQVSKWTRERWFSINYNGILFAYSGSTGAVGANANVSLGKYISPLANAISANINVQATNGNGGVYQVKDPNTGVLIGYGVARNNYSSTYSIHANNYLQSNIDPEYNMRFERIVVSGSPQFNIFLSGYQEKD
jgi:hypothetical protein